MNVPRLGAARRRMSHSQFGRGEAGVNTVEGNLAGRRAAQLAKKREKDQLEFEAKKRKIQDEHQRGLGNIDQKFKSITHDAFHLDFVGLKTKEEFKVLKDAAEEEYEKKTRKEDLVKKKELEDKKRKKEKAKKASRLSFAVRGEEDGEEAEATSTKKELTKKALKNPEVETSFLPDPHQEREEEALRQRLKQEWLEEQERIKNELLEVTYSYWDGSGHRRVIKLNKGTTIGKFLEQVKQQLSQEFSDVRAISPDDLMYIKEDLIIPHNFSFYDLIVTKARGKSGPLFHFDVHDDVRIVHDSRIEKDESHPGKVVDRKWYERNKHIFPASRWEVYDPKVQRAHPYTIHGHEINGKKQKDNE